MPANTTPDNIVYPTTGDQIAPLNAVFQDLAQSVQNALSGTGAAYRYGEQLRLTANSNFTKASYPALRAIFFRVQGGGGGGGGAATTGAGQNAVAASGGGGGYAEAWITNIAGIAASAPITVGSGGAGGGAGNLSGVAGAASSFLSVTGGGGQPGSGSPAAVVPTSDSVGGVGGTGAGGTLNIAGGRGGAGFAFSNIRALLASPGSSMFSPAGGLFGWVVGSSGPAGTGLGGGGIGGANVQNQTIARTGGNGSDGIVIIDLYY